MESLVFCPCGHSLARHEWDGCAGDRSESCGCTLDRRSALEAAIDSVRTVPVYFSSDHVTRPMRPSEPASAGGPKSEGCSHWAPLRFLNTRGWHGDRDPHRRPRGVHPRGRVAVENGDQELTAKRTDCGWAQRMEQ
jgi:hypothetical protein